MVVGQRLSITITWINFVDILYVDCESKTSKTFRQSSIILTLDMANRLGYELNGASKERVYEILIFRFDKIPINNSAY